MDIHVDSGDTTWVLVATTLVLFMTPGVAFFYGGSVGNKNVIGTMFQSFATMGVISVLWVIVGFSLVYGDDVFGIIGSPLTYFMFDGVTGAQNDTLAPSIPFSAFSMFGLTFAIITPALVTGSLVERSDFRAVMLLVSLWTLVVYCPLAHIVWHPDGFLKQLGYLDFAGGIPVEMASGFGALSASVFLGHRKAIEHNPASIPNVLLGTAILWFGWFGFNAGGVLAANGLTGQIFMTTNTAAGGGMVTWVVLDSLNKKPNSSIGLCNGIIVGLVAITPACAYVTTGASMIIGAMAAIVCYYVGQYMKSTNFADDALDVFPIHGCAGVCGVILTSIFSCINVNPNGRDGLLYGDPTLVFVHLLALLITVPYVLCATYLSCMVTNKFIEMRMSDEAEALGMDISCHGESVSGHGLALANFPGLSKLYGSAVSEKYPGIQSVLSASLNGLRDSSFHQEDSQLISTNSFGANAIYGSNIESVGRVDAEFLQSSSKTESTIQTSPIPRRADTINAGENIPLSPGGYLIASDSEDSEDADDS